MILDLVVNSSDDGYTASIPSIKGIDCWAHKQDDVINEALKMLCYYLNFEDASQIKIDMARKEKNKIIYKLIFNKEIN